MATNLAELEKNLKKNYDQLNKIYAEMAEQDSTQLDAYPLNYLMKFPSISNYLINRIKMLYAQETDPLYMKYYLSSRLAVSLFSGNLAEYNLVLSERYKIDITESALSHDFRPLNGLTVIAENATLRILADIEADIALCKHLTKGLTAKVLCKFDKFKPKPSIFMLRGRGPSPCNPKTHCIFMMVGHYEGTDYEQKIFRTSITHELTHLQRWQYHKLTIDDKNINMHKFFDEGLAMQKGYTVLDDCSVFYQKFLNTAWAIYKYSELSIDDIMENWQENLNNNLQILIYDYACAFVNWLDEAFPDKPCKSFYHSWIGQKEITTAREYFPLYYGISLEDVLAQWVSMLKEYQPLLSDTNATNINIIRIDNEKAVFQYTSKYDLWPEHHILCVYDNKTLLKIKSHQDNKFRYLTQGRFEINYNVPGLFDESKLEFYILANEEIEICSIK